MANAPPPLSRRQLEEILGLSPGTSFAEMLRAAIRLLTRLENRRKVAQPEERTALENEIEGVAASLLACTGSEASTEDLGGGTIASPVPDVKADLSAAKRRERTLIGIIVLLGAALLALFTARPSSLDPSADRRVEVEPAVLLVESRPTNAELRVRRPEQDELLFKLPAGGTRIELAPGRYTLEVSREDCPDAWTQEIELETAETRRYEPTICIGTGELIVRSNVSQDRLLIDGLDLGPTRAAPHLVGVGDHQVRVEKRGFAAFEGRVRIRPDEKLELHAELVAETGPGSQRADTPVAALPFEIIAPSKPPGTPGGVSSDPGHARAAGAFLPKPVLPDPVPAESLRLPNPLFDQDLPHEGTGGPRGGSTTWHDEISKRVLERFDRDGSGLIDRVAETESIPCDYWLGIERSFDEGRLGLSMSRLYGFDGSEWHPKALGFDRAQRMLAYERMKACGLAP